MNDQPPQPCQCDLCRPEPTVRIIETTSKALAQTVRDVEMRGGTIESFDVSRSVYKLKVRMPGN